MYLEHGNPFSFKHPRTEYKVPLSLIGALLLTVFKRQSVIDKHHFKLKHYFWV